MDNGLDEPYHDGLRDHRLLVQRCVSCRGWQWPPEVICHRCRGFELGWEEPESTLGTIFTWTRVWYAGREGLEVATPYIVVVVELPSADGARIVGNLLGDRNQDVEVGMQVTPQFEDHDDPEQPYALLQWRPI